MAPRSEFSDGEFKGEVLARLKEMSDDIKGIYSKLGVVNGRCLSHTQQIAANTTRGNLLTWLLGIVIGGFLGLIGWMIHLSGKP